MSARQRRVLSLDSFPRQREQTEINVKRTSATKHHRKCRRQHNVGDDTFDFLRAFAKTAILAQHKKQNPKGKQFFRIDSAFNERITAKNHKEIIAT